ncbi:MAG: serine/threonine-protein kinase [Magnetovibrio sp.]|nr:serine/threonine-protein kinase [Magnetovibrio sp.]
MAEQPLEAEEMGADLPGGLVPPEMESSEGVEAETDAGTAPPDTEERSTPILGGGGPVLLRDRFLVDTGKPLPELDCPSAKAYAVEDRRDLSRHLYGLVCTPGLPIRIDAIRAIKDLDIRGILPLVDWDAVTWPPLGQKAMVVIFQRPMGGRVADRMARKEVKITEYDMPRRVIEPITEGLQAINNLDAPHRAIRPDNIYFLDEDMTDVVLGPFVVAPPGYDQAVLMEPIERAMAMPAGRGKGNSRDDIFAIGVTMVLLLLGYNPVGKIKDEDLIHARIEQGSYTAICGTARIPMQMIEPLRGMLADDPTERWDFNEMTNWLSGQKINPIKKRPIDKAENPFTFRGRKHLTARSIAHHFCKHPSDAVRAASSDEFQDWVKRGLDKGTISDAIKGAVQASKFHEEGHQGSDDFLVARISTILDPKAPVRYKGLSFAPDGYGPVLAVQWVRNGDPQAAAEVLAHEVSALWFTAQPRLHRELAELQKNLAQLRGLLSIQDPGYGLERVLYESNPSMACQSPFVIKDCVSTIEQLLPALDAASNSGDTSTHPMDRHVSAFIAARFGEDIHPHLRALASSRAETSIVGMLSLLAFLQWKLRTPAVLGLSSWVGGLLGPAINAYHNRQTRQELERDIPRLVRKGSLPELFNLVDDAEKRREDSEGFETAQAEWLSAEEEIRDIEGAGEERLTKAERSGQQAAAMISITIALTVVSVILLIETL